MFNLDEGISFYNEKKYGEALTFFLGCKSGSPEDAQELAYYIGLTYARLSGYEDSLIYLEQVVTSDTNIARIYQCRLILALVYIKTDRIKLAEFELKKLLESGYESAQVFSSMAFVCYEHDDTDMAIEYYEKALEIDKNNTTALNGLGYILADSGKDVKKALIYCKRAADKFPENPAYLDSLAWAYFKSGFLTEASSSIKKARKQIPNNKTINFHAEIIAAGKKEADK